MQQSGYVSTNETDSLEPKCYRGDLTARHLTEPQTQRGTGVPVQHFQPVGLMSINGTHTPLALSILNLLLAQFCLVKTR